MRKIALTLFCAVSLMACSTTSSRDTLAQTELAYVQAQTFWIDHCVKSVSPSAFCEPNKDAVKQADLAAVASIQAANDALNGLSSGVSTDTAISVAIQALTTYANLIATFQGAQ